VCYTQLSAHVNSGDVSRQERNGRPFQPDTSLPPVVSSRSVFKYPTNGRKRIFQDLGLAVKRASPIRDKYGTIVVCLADAYIQRARQLVALLIRPTAAMGVTLNYVDHLRAAVKRNNSSGH
jgi:hypothetical protein